MTIRGLLIASALSLALPMSALAAEQELPDLQGWHPAAQKAAKKMTEKYGQPDGVTDTMLVWHDSGPWRRTVVYKEAVEHDFPMPHPDVLEQFIAYDVPPDQFDELASYDGSVIAERTKGEISARCDKEAANFLAINLANDIVTGERSVDEARQFYAETVKKLMKGEKPEYTQGFVFDVARSYEGDPDVAVIDKTAMKEQQ